ncbi:hypothetical protein SO802_007765 [Lithocarpus litseifolius]|uniref:RNase H type-1 domain-containing protein n=1 Tax=Lithocarpus litseifolius TaxID=425828 RepID=A0AAW2DPY3_9ROSI
MVHRTIINVQWNRPPANWYNLNSDESSLGNPRLAGEGGIIRNSDREWVSGYARAIGCTTSVAVEPWALRDGLNICINLNLPAVEVELDAKLVVDLLEKENPGLNGNDVLVADCKDSLKQDRQTSVLMHLLALNPKLQEEQRNLASWAQICIDRGTISKIIDPYLTNKIVPECLKVYVELAKSCICDQGIQRPTMNDVMEKLEFALKLQEQAEATKDTDSEVESFHVATTNGAPWYSNFYHGQVLESNSGTEFSTISTGLSYPGLNFVVTSITSEDVSSCTKNSSS